MNLFYSVQIPCHKSENTKPKVYLFSWTDCC